MKILSFLFFYCFLFLCIPTPSATAIGENEKAIAPLQEKPPSREWSFAVLGDNRFSSWYNDWMYERILASMSRVLPDFAVNTGDFVNNGTEEEYVSYLNRIRLLKFPTINVVGNHDIKTREAKLFKKYLGPTYFYFDYQNARFIIVNNSYHIFGGDQLEWLDKALAEAQDSLKFVFMHIPTFNPSRDRGFQINWGEDYLLFDRIIRRHKVDILFTGHVHLFHDKVHRGIRNIITAGAGAPLYEVPERGGVYHWVHVRVKERQIQIEPVIIPTPFLLRIVYRIVFFFLYDVRVLTFF
jgi:predicted phosphodiesterase